ncbi:hypothetical protein AURDEDRAFT_117223 [Auricularia subglabra TFB-10046 SS5]|nr:hypothetical protein AURDEDRAFT_117223 [Auricularia subglabra TFB-10046 SS5]
MGRPGDPLPDVAARLGPMIARVRAFCVGGGSATLVALRDYLAHPAPELVSFMATAVDTEPDARLVFFPSAPKLEYLYWRGFVLTLRSPLLALETANFEAGSMGELVRVALVSLNLIAMILHLTAPIVHPPLPLRTVLHLDLTCHAPISAACLRAPVLHSAVLKFTEPGIVDLHMLGVFLQGSGARLAQLELSFAGDFTELAAALAPCAQLRELTLGNIGWATSFVAAFLRDMARADPAGEWICAQLEELKLRVVELESAVRTNLVGLAEARCASVPAGERPLSPLRFIEVVRSDEGNDLSRRKNYSALNKKLHEILATD